MCQSCEHTYMAVAFIQCANRRDGLWIKWSFICWFAATIKQKRKVKSEYEHFMSVEWRFCQHAVWIWICVSTCSVHFDAVLLQTSTSLQSTHCTQQIISVQVHDICILQCLQLHMFQHVQMSSHLELLCCCCCMHVCLCILMFAVWIER